MRSLSHLLAAAAFAAFAAACATTPAPPPASGPTAGPPRGLGAPAVVNRRDFIYALDFSSGGELAFVHHVSSHMELSAATTHPLAPRFQEKVNPTEFDVEDVLIADVGPARGAIFVPSRQGILRAFDGTSGKLLRELTVGTPLLRTALSPDGSLLVASAADGRLFLVDAAGFALRGTARVHGDEVRGLAFLPDGRLVTASVDGQLVVTAFEPGAPAEQRLPSGALASGERAFLAQLLAPAPAATQAISTIRDVRQPVCAVSTAAVKRLGLAMAADGARLDAQTSAGPQSYPAVELGRVVLGTLDLGPLRAAVCDLCVPAGAELVLGGDALTRASIADDVAKDEIVVKAGAGPDAAAPVAGALVATTHRTVALPGPANDLDVSASGAVLVTFSDKRAERSYELYEAEKAGKYPAPSEASAAALVDVEKGALLRRFVGHRGFAVTGALSPDGRTVATGGWDKRVLVFDAESGKQVAERELAWLVRRVRFSPDGGTLGVGAWTPVNAFNGGDSEPALLLYPLVVEAVQVAAK